MSIKFLNGISPAATDTQVQFTSGGDLAGSSSLTWDGSTLQAAAVAAPTLNVEDSAGTAHVSITSAISTSFDYLLYTGLTAGKPLVATFAPSSASFITTGYGSIFIFNNGNYSSGVANSGFVFAGDVGNGKQVLAANNVSGSPDLALVFRTAADASWSSAPDLLTISPTGTTHLFNTSAASRVVVAVQAFASQSAALQEWRNSGGTPLASVTSAGVFSGSGASLTALNASNLSSGTVPTSRLGSGTASSSTYLKGDQTYGVPLNLLVTATDGPTVTFNLALSNLQIVTLGGNRILAVSNVTTGQPFQLILLQDGTGSRTVTWFSGIIWDSGSAPTLTTTAGKHDTFAFINKSSGVYLGYVVKLGQ